MIKGTSRNRLCMVSMHGSSQSRAEVEESVKRGIEASVPGLIETTLRGELQTLIPALVKEEMKKQLQALPPLVEETIKTQFKTCIPELDLSVITAVKRAMSLVPSATISRPSPQLVGSFDSTPLHLKFVGKLPKWLFTKETLKDQGASLTVELHDQSGNKVDSGPESSANIKILVVDEDLKVEDELTDEDINKHVVLPRKDKGPLLKGTENAVISLCKGVASVSEFAFTDNSKAMRNGKFRLGARVLNGGFGIKGAVSVAVQVKEHRNAFNKKSGTLSLKDEVWHLVNIAKNGQTHKKLVAGGVHLVEDFLERYNNNSDDKKLLQIFGESRKKLKETVEMAKSRIQPEHNHPIEHEEMLNFQPQPVGTSSENQVEQTSQISTQTESVYGHSTAAAYMHPNATGPYQGMTPNELREATMLPNYYTPSPGLGNFSIDDSGFFEMKCFSPRWNPLRAALRFKIAVKVSVRDGPRAGKRQKLS